MLVSSSHLSLKPEVNCRFHFNSNNLIYTNCGPKAINLNIKWELIKIANRPRFRPSKSGSLLSRGLAVFSQCLFGSYFPACRSFWVTTGKRTLLEFSAQQLFQNTEDWADPACPPLLGRLSLSLSQLFPGKESLIPVTSAGWSKWKSASAQVGYRGHGVQFI